MVANLQPLTGKDGYIVLLNGTSTPAAAEACSDIGATGLPGGTMVYPAKQVYSVTLRTKKVIDARLPVVVKNSTVPLPKTQYKILYGSGVVLFRQPLTGTPAITVDMSYIPTVTATDVVAIEHVRDWVINLTAPQVPGDEYGPDIVPEYRGKFSGTWQFERLASSSGLDLFYLMLLQSYFIFALYEELQSNRMWVIYGDLSASPQNAPTGAVAGGTVTGVLKQLPSFLVEPL